MSYDTVSDDDKFQFHKGTIRTNTALSFLFPLFLFQFHKGTIRTSEDYRLSSLLSAFQFHKGTIRTSSLSLSSVTSSNFNSIKVRLERENTLL